MVSSILLTSQCSYCECGKRRMILEKAAEAGIIIYTG
jgi:hypothetical protein